MDKSYTIAYFISPHGLGHASRASAVMEETHRIMPEIRFEIFTLVPEWFFKSSLHFSFGYHPLLTDIGLVQKTPLIEDMEKTIEKLDGFLPFKPDEIDRLVATIKDLECKLIICDISALGIAVAKRAGIPSILIENFTWDWIYEGYEEHLDGLKKHIDYLREIYGFADYHIQTEPICNPYDNTHLKTGPVSRRPRKGPEKVREMLKIPEGKRMVMFTISGDSGRYGSLRENIDADNIYFVIQGVSSMIQRKNNLILLPENTDLFHPDLVNASDLTIGKLGYSTVAEVYHSGVPFGYLTRKRFRESGRLEEFCRREMNCLSIDEEYLHDRGLLTRIFKLLEMPRIKRNQRNGAIDIAEFIINLLKG